MMITGWILYHLKNVLNRVCSVLLSCCNSKADIFICSPNTPANVPVLVPGTSQVLLEHVYEEANVVFVAAEHSQDGTADVPLVHTKKEYVK